MQIDQRFLRATISIFLAVLFTACGGGGGGSASDNVVPVSNTGVGGTVTGKPFQVSFSDVVNGVQGVPVTTGFNLRFSSAISAAGVRSDQVELSDGTSTIPLAIYVADSLLVLTPPFQLRAGTEYRLTIKAGIAAANGGVLGGDYVIRFTTAIAEYELLKLAPVDMSVHGGDMPRMIIADINGDGRADLVELAALYRPEQIGNGYTINIYLQNKDKGFDKFQKLEVLVDQSGFSKYFTNLFALDLDGDGKPELLVPEYRETDPEHNGIRVFKAGANGEYAASDFIATNYTSKVQALDIDGDGKIDLLGSARRAVDQQTGGFQVLLRTASGFSKLAPIALPDGGYEFEMADLDQDGKRELLVNHYFYNRSDGATELSVYSQGQPGVFSLNAGLTAETAGFCAKADYCNNMKVVDWNNDGKPVLLFEARTSNNPSSLTWLYAFMRKPEGGLASVFETPRGDASLYDARDMNGDGVADLVLFSPDLANRSLYFIVVHGKRDFSTEPYSRVYFPGDIDPPNLAIGDIDGDGRIDLVLDSYNAGIMLARRTRF